MNTNEQLFKDLAGEYHFIYADRHIMITSSGTNLYAEEIEDVKILLIPEDPYTYRFRNSNGGITFQLDNKGKVAGLIYHHDGERAAQKVK